MPRARFWIESLLPAFVLFVAPPIRAEPQVLVERAEPTVERIVFDPKNRPKDMPPLKPGEAALCQSNFNCDVSLRYEVVEDASGESSGMSVRAHVKQVKVRLTLHNRIYLPRGATPKIRAHEEGHRIINERVYEDAEAVARRAALEVLTGTWRGSGPDADAAGKSATDAAVRKLCDAYLAATAVKAGRVGEIYDELTNHGRNTKLTEAEAIKQSFDRWSGEQRER